MTFLHFTTNSGGLDTYRATCVFNQPNHQEKPYEQRKPQQPFGSEQIKRREGNFGKKLDYIEGHAVTQRLNDAFDGEWSIAMPFTTAGNYRMRGGEAQ